MIIDLQQYWIDHAIQVIADTYGDQVSVNEKKKDLLKFGESTQVQTTNTTLMTLPSGTYNETYVRRNLITHISSSNVNDTGIIKIEGHTVGSDLSVSSLTQTSGIATATTSVTHGYADGDWVYIEGAVETEYNGIVQITVTGTTTFTFAVDSGATSPATGTITATNQNKTFVVQTKQLAGQTKTALDTPLARMTTMYLPTQDRATPLVGNIYGYQDVAVTLGVPDVDTAVHCMIALGKQISQKASISLSKSEYWIVTYMHAHMLTKQASFADVKLEIREEGSVFRELDNVNVSSSSATNSLPFLPYLIISKNSDVRLVADADVAGRSVGGSMQGVLAKIVS